MGRPKQKVQSGFVLFDVCYEDGTRTSNRKVPATELGGLDGDAPARTGPHDRRDARARRTPGLIFDRGHSSLTPHYTIHPNKAQGSRHLRELWERFG